MPAVQSLQSYDDAPYMTRPWPQAHLERLATTAHLFALSPTPIDHCKVLDLGCASGGHILPLAELYPSSTFVGVDLSSRQIDEGRKTITALGLPIITLRHASITDIDPTWGQFDYVIAHGVYSWVPADVRDALLRVCSQNLSPNGIAYVSYNTLPGWHRRRAVRDLLLFHAQRVTDPAQRVPQSREFLKFVAQSAPKGSPYAHLLQSELALLENMPDSYIQHEHLAGLNEPVYFQQFIQHAAQHQLQFISESYLWQSLPTSLGQQTESTLPNLCHDWLDLQQHLDLIVDRTHRQSLLCHANVPLRYELSPDRLRGLYVESFAAPVQSTDPHRPGVEFRGPTGVGFVASDPTVQAAMFHLRRNRPGAVLFESLLDHARKQTPPTDGDESRLATTLLRAHAADLVDLYTRPPLFGSVVPERPRATRLARFQAQQGKEVVNLRHELKQLSIEDRALLRLLDGSKDRQALLSAASLPTAPITLDDALLRLNDLALLVNE